MKRALVAGAFLAVAALGGAGAMATGAWTPWAGDGVQGVDVSWHQGAIDWRALRADGVGFAYIKATEGGDYVDPRFARNWEDSARAGIPHGAYHYFTLCRSGAAQAAHFMANVPREAGMLAPTVDVEHRGPCRQGPTMNDLTGELRIYLDTLEAHYGVRPILYTTREYHDAHLSDLQGERFWLRSLFARPAYRTNDWVIWQHHNAGRKRGVSGPVDLNTFRGDDADLARLTVRAEPTT